MDGSLTGGNPNSWATTNFKFNADNSHCTIDEDIYNGITCTDDVEVRRVSLFGSSPRWEFRG